MLQTIQSAPVIRTSKKSTHGVLDEDRAIVRALDASVGLDCVQPIIFGGKLLGWARGDMQSRDVYFRKPFYGEKWYAGYTSYDDVISEVTQSGKKFSNHWAKVATTAGVLGNYYDLWPVSGNPTAGTYTGSAFTARVLTDADVGALYHGGNVSTDTKHYLNAMGMCSAGTPTLFLYDRCLTYELCTFNAAANQAFTNGSTLSRYQNAGEGACKIMATCQAVMGATASNITQLRYTNQAGTALQSMPTTTTVATIVSAAAPTANLGARVIAPATLAATLPWCAHIPLNSIDGGARLINDWTTSAANTGSVCFILMRPLAIVPCPTAGVASLINLIQEIPSMERIRDGACLSAYCFIPAATGFTAIGSMEVGWG